MLLTRPVDTPFVSGRKAVLRVTALASSAAVVLGLLSAPATGAAQVRDETTAPSTAPTPGIAWGACADAELRGYDLQCARLAVPLDRADPARGTITLALSRRLHTASAYQGVMLVNPGGPGGSGLSLATIGDYVPGDAGAGYDWIGFDPRGVGASSPALRCTTSYFGVNRPSYVPHSNAVTRYWLAKNRAYADACASTATKRALLPHLSTLDTVQDMESIREALGASMLNFYGFSYGSYLGQVYATRHPSRVRRFVLDGVVDSSRTWYAANLDQDRGFDANLNVFWRWVAAHDRSFHLGKRWRAIRRGYYRKLTALGRRPAANRRLGPAELTDALVDAGYYVYSWPVIADAYSQLVRHQRGGALLSLYRDSEMGDDNGFAVYNAVQCTDVSWPGWAQTLHDASVLNRAAPFLTWSNTWYNAPCLSWHAPRHTRVAVTGRSVASKMLLVNETRDAATPYSGALATRSRFPTASLVAGVGGTTHSSSLSGVACVDHTVATYLRNGTVPARLSGTRADRSCPRVAPPSPASYGLRSTGGSVDRLPPRIRHDLMAAQRFGG